MPDGLAAPRVPPEAIAAGAVPAPSVPPPAVAAGAAALPAPPPAATEAVLRRHLEELETIYRLSERVSRAEALSEVYQAALDGLVLTLGAQRASVLLVEPDGVMRFQAWRGLSDAYRQAVADHSPWTADTRGPEPIAIDDIEGTGLGALEAVIRAEGIRALAFIPLVDHGRLLGKLMVYYDQPHPFSADDLRLAQTIARHVAFAIERWRGQNALRESEECYRLLFENALEAILLADEHGRFLDANHQAERLTGYSREQLLQMTVQDLTAPAAQAEAQQVYQAFAEVGRGVGEYDIAHADGHVVHVEFAASRVAPGRYQAILHNITERRRAEAERAEWLAREQAARGEAESARRLSERHAARVARLQQISAALAAALTPQRVADVIVAEALAALEGRAAAALVLPDEDGAGELIATRGLPDKLVAAWRRNPPGMRLPIREAIAGGKLVLLENEADWQARFPEAHALWAGPDGSAGAAAAIPLVVEGRAMGGLAVLFPGPRAFSPEDREFMFALARHCAQTLERARLYEAERRARAQAEAAQRRLAFLAGAGTRLSFSLEFEATLAGVARLALPELADCCILDLCQPDGSLRQVVRSHADPAGGALLAQLAARYAPERNPAYPVHEVLAQGRTLLCESIPPQALADAAGDAETLQHFEQLGPGSYLVVPLRARGRTLGALSLLMTSSSGRRYGPGDQALAEELAGRIALAVDNARLYQELQQAVRIRDEFLSVAAHELKTPITNLRGFVQMALRRLERRGELEPARLERTLNAINEQSGKLARLVGQLLDISRIEAGRLALQYAEIDLVAVARAALQGLPAAGAQAVRLDMPDALPLEADALRLEQVLVNLVSNALKYSPPGMPIDVELAAPDPEHVRLTVTDYGIGIAPQHRSHIFDRFYQAHTDDQHSGMGLGLYISRQIVELHGGRIAAEFPPDGGSRFTVVLPVRRPPDRPETGATA